MLVLTRRIGELIHVRDEITVMIGDVDRGEVRLGITAPKEVPVHREEIYRRILAKGNGEPEKP